MERMEHSAELGSLAKALAAAQSKVGNASKDAVNPHFKNRYATLASVRAAITGPLSEHGLAVIQTTEPHGDAGVCVVTMLIHESGQWVRGKLFVPVAKKDAQAFGAALSYGRRFALGAIVGIATEDDDDGAEASAPAARPMARPAPVAAPAAPLSADPFVKRINEATTTAELAVVSKDIGAVKARLSKEDLTRCRAAMTAAEARLSEQREAS